MPRPITVTYTLHPTTGPQREHLLDALTGIQAQLPLRNLHWKSSTRTALRTIQEVNVRLTDLGELGSQREVGGSVMDGALVNICLVACDDGDIYKNATRSFIRDWLSLLSSRRNVYAPLIVLVNPPTARDTGKNVFGRDKGILGKLKSDFNLPKRDRCAQVNLPSGNVADPAAWPEVMTRLKESIVYAFDAAIMEREEEVKRGEAQRLTVGWNFCTWFLLKESLAYSFEGLSLPEDALLVYEELDATFLQILKENNLSWFGKLGASGAQDDSLPILDTAAKPYREMLQHSQITVFDFRIYVFARQAALLGALGRITEVAKRGQWFVASLARRLRESEADLAEYFIESWTYTACMDIVARCDEWSRLDRPNGDYSGLIAYESARSELLDIARVQVEHIGVASGHLPDIYPFSLPSGLIPPSDDVLFDTSDAGLSDNGHCDAGRGSATKGGQSFNRAGPSNAKLAEALKNADKLRALYTTTTKAALAAYEACGKINSGVRLKVDLAALAIHEQKWQTSYSLCQALVRDCVDLKTSRDVLRFALEGLLTSHQGLGLPRDAAWAETATGILQNEAREQRRGATSERVQDIIAALRDLQEQYTMDDPECFSTSLLTANTRSSSTMTDALEADVAITNQLAQAIEVDDIEVVFQDTDGNDVIFRVGSAVLSPGVNKLQAHCITSIQGIYRFAHALIRLGSTTFKVSQLASPGTLRIRRGSGGMRTELAMPNDLALDQPPGITLRIMTGSAEMSDIQVIVYSMTGDVILDPSKASSSTGCTPETSCIRFDRIGGRARVEVSIPYRGTAAGEVIQCRVRVKYISGADDLPREYVDTQSVFTGLPLTVNVQDFFRPDSLTSHFTIASDGREYLRIKSIDLQAGDEANLEFQSPSKGSRREMIVTPDRHIASLFKIRQTGVAGPSSAGAVLRLVITYRNMEEEARLRLPADTTASAAAQALRNRRSWLPEYVTTGKLPRDMMALDTAAEPIADLPWRTLTIPVEVPSRRLLVSARLSRSTSSTTYEGRAIAIQLSLRAHYTWAGEVANEHNLSFDILPDSEEWIVLGRKKGTFAVSRASGSDDESEDHTTQLTLVPMRPGTLALPNVAVSIIPRPGSRDPSQLLICETFVENAAEAIRVLPAARAMSAIVPVFPPRPTSLQQGHWDEIAA